MCNPRRVRVEATKKIAEAWQAEITQAATARGDVNAEARLVQPISDLLPPPSRAAFEQAMAGSADWAEADGEYRRDVPGGYLAYRPATGELEIAIKLSEAIEAVGEATLVASGKVVDEVVAEGEASWYGNLTGLDKQAAERRAKEAAEQRAAELAADRAQVLKEQAAEAARHALSESTGKAAEEAQRTADSRLALQAEQTQSMLDARAAAALETVHAETLKSVFQLVAAGYSGAIQAYAAEHGDALQVTERDGVIEIEFELES